MVVYIPKRADIISVEFDPQQGKEIKKNRPALVISPQAYNKIGLLLCMPITTQIKNYPFEVLLPPLKFVKGAILCDQIRSFDWKARKAKFLGTIPDNIARDCLAKLETLTGYF